MRKEHVELDRETKTLLVSLYAKAMDSRAKRPILRDRGAAAAADRLDYDPAELKIRTDDAVAMVARAEQLDRWTVEFLGRYPDATVLHLGCGLDRRVDRVHPPAGVRWYDLDLPEVIDLCEQLYPERTGHRWLASSVTEPHWLDEVPDDRPVLVVAEGLTMLLAENEVKTLLERIVKRFPGGQLVFDAYSLLAVRTMARHPTFKAIGIAPTWGIDDARDLDRWIPGLTFDREWFMVGSRHVLKMPFSSILVSYFMYLVPKLRRYSRLVRYRF